MSDETYELLDLYRDEADGKLKGRLRLASGVEVVREVKSVEIEAKVHRAATGETEDLGVVAATYSNAATELAHRRAHPDGKGVVHVPEHETAA